jgi:hypothetical protein
MGAGPDGYPSLTFLRVMHRLLHESITTRLRSSLSRADVLLR